jgi:hypothetical protein
MSQIDGFKSFWTDLPEFHAKVFCFSVKKVLTFSGASG